MELGFQLWEAQSTQTARVVFLHGMGGTGQLWRPIAVALENHFTILAPDQRGHGKSQLAYQPGSRALPTYLPLDYGRDLVETLETLRFHPAFLVGHSMGVRTACAAAHLKPDWVRGLVLVDLGFSGMAGGGLGKGLAKFLKALPQGFGSRAEARAFMTQNCPDLSIAQYLLAVSVSAPNGEIRFPFDHAALIQTIYAARDSSVRTWVQELAERDIPILVLRGAQSLVWSREEFESEKRHFLNLPKVVFEEVADAGHGLPFEKRLEFVQRLERFFNEHLN